MPCNYKLYSPEWKTRIVPDIRKRSGDCCEQCGLRNYSVGYRNEDGHFIPTYGNIDHDLAGTGISYPSLMPLTYKEAREFSVEINELCEGENKHIVIVLTVAHLDHDISNNDYSNLRHLCQQCHNRLDVADRKVNRKKNKGVLDLFNFEANV